jgi:hypothetical protein
MKLEKYSKHTSQKEIEEIIKIKTKTNDKLKSKITKYEKIIKNRFDEDGLIYDFRKTIFLNNNCHILPFYFETKNKEIAIDIYNKDKKVKRNYQIWNKHKIQVLTFSYKQILYRLNEIMELIYSYEPKFINDVKL